jgi:hypothetical protein
LEGDRCFDGNNDVWHSSGATMKLCLVSNLLLVICLSEKYVQSLRFQKIKKNEIKKEYIPQLNSDLLPPLETVLEELHLSHRKSALVKLGVTETRYLLRLKSMDYQMMVRAGLDLAYFLLISLCSSLAH